MLAFDLKKTSPVSKHIFDVNNESESERDLPFSIRPQSSGDSLINCTLYMNTSENDVALIIIVLKQYTPSPVKELSPTTGVERWF